MTYVKLEPAATRLGNWMFQYAAAKCAAPNEPVTFVIPSEQMRYVPAVEKYRALWGEGKCLSEGVGECLNEGDVRVGLFQNAKCVDRQLSRSLFLGPLRDACRHPSTSTLDFDSLVSIHVRRGDYLKLPHRHPFVGKAYLREAVARFPGAEFLVFSDDLAWCRRFFKGPRYHFSEGTDVLTDLYLMTQCKGGHICSNSTFSWWGAYLGVDSARTIFPSMWYGLAMPTSAVPELMFEGCEILENHYSLPQFLWAVAHWAKASLGAVLRRLKREKKVESRE